MRLSEYLPEVIARLCGYVHAALESDDEAAASVSLQNSLALIERVLDTDECPHLEPPTSIGDTRWDTLISASLLDVLGPQWSAPHPLPEPWFPMSETGADRALTKAATPAFLANVSIHISQHNLQ